MNVIAPSGNTGAYCRARAKLPEAVIRRLTLGMAKGCEETVPSSRLWHGRHVKLVDGTTASMPDTFPPRWSHTRRPLD